MGQNLNGHDLPPDPRRLKFAAVLVGLLSVTGYIIGHL